MAEGAREELGVVRMCRFVNEISLFMKFRNFIFLIPWLIFFLASCSVSRQISKQAEGLLNDSAVSKGFTGISIYEPATGKYWYNYNATKYFTPASNTKLFSLYAGMKYLGDSLPGINYQLFNDTSINIFATGDPSFLHPDFNEQPVLNFLRVQNKHIYLSDKFRDSSLGKGWAWDDYNDDYMVERNSFPIFGNTIKINLSGYKEMGLRFSVPNWKVVPGYFKHYLPSMFIPDIFLYLLSRDSSYKKKLAGSFALRRDWASNMLNFLQGDTEFSKAEIPFKTMGLNTAISILKEDFNLTLEKGRLIDDALYGLIPKHLEIRRINSQPSDSMFKPMMHRSDNFFAEQTLLMVSNERLGNMNDEAIIDTLLRLDMKDIPQQPKWVDGSGLSRYNLFTPQSFIYIQNKLYTEFGLKRLKSILPTGGEGTLKSFYIKDSGFIYAKTGTLSNNCALSGFLITNRGKLLIFSILANHYQSGATLIRRATERFLTGIRRKY